MIPRRARALVVVVLAATACADDSSVADEPPPITTPAADEPEASPSPTTTTTSAITTTPTTPVPPDGDLSTAAVHLDPLIVLDSPVDTTVAPDGELWVALRSGEVVAVNHETGEPGDILLDLSDKTTTSGERGLLGITTNDEFLFVNHTDNAGDTNIVAYRLGDDGRPGDRRVLLIIEQPFSNHNGGGLTIGPGGYLYIGVGDGGGADDPLLTGQDPTRLLGSILRIDPTVDDDDRPYAIPADNPFADGIDGRPEIFAIGARNPWRLAFDRQTNDFWVADVGQDSWEEIDLMLAADGGGLGANLGWNLREGTHEFAGARPAANVDPVFEYPHRGDSPSGCSISGGQVYRGAAIPELVGAYVFGDYCAGNLWAVSVAGDEVVFRDLGGEIDQLVGITTDPDGELLALSLTGAVSRIVPG